MNKSCGGRALRSRTIFALEELSVALFALEELLGKLTMHLSFYFHYQRFFFLFSFWLFRALCDCLVMSNIGCPWALLISDLFNMIVVPVSVTVLFSIIWTQWSSVSLALVWRLGYLFVVSIWLPSSHQSEPFWIKREMWLSLVHFCLCSPCSAFLVILLCFLWVSRVHNIVCITSWWC